MIASRATFVIDKFGLIRHQSYNDIDLERNFNEVVRLVKALKAKDDFK